jgi:predicted double-glycine peptidase
MRPLPALMLCGAVSVALAPPAPAMDLSTPGIAQLSVNVKSLRATRCATPTRQQYDFSCGSAALATLMTHHYGTPVSEAAIFERMFLDGDQAKIRREGFSMLDMQRYLARRGFKADGFELPLSKLMEAKLPAIVLLSENGYHHFVVIKGAADGRVLVGDPSSGTRALALERFQALWPSKLLFVIHGQAGKATFNGSADWQAAPVAPLAQGIDRAGLAGVTMARHGPGEF